VAKEPKPNKFDARGIRTIRVNSRELKSILAGHYHWKRFTLSGGTKFTRANHNDIIEIIESGKFVSFFERLGTYVLKVTEQLWYEAEFRAPGSIRH
jgi:hypothetical protein